MPRNQNKKDAEKQADSMERMRNLAISLHKYPRAEEFAEKFFRITPKIAGPLIPFKYNRCQRKLAIAWEKAAIDPDTGNRRAVMLLILKPRQIGCSTWVESKLLEEMLRRQNSTGLTISHETKSAQHMLDILKRFYNNMPDEMRLPERYLNRNELCMSEPHNGRIFVETAGVGKGKTGAGHSHTLQMIHASEIGAWEDKSRVWDGLMNAFNAQDPNSIAIFESSSWGSGNWHEELWNQAVAGENGFMPVFLSWLDHEEYELPNIEMADLGKLNDDERKLIEDYDATANQIAWRRWTIRNTFNGSVRRFKQWYPSTPQEAFQSETNLFLDERKLELRKAHLKDPIFKGELNPVRKQGKSVDLQPKEDSAGGLHIWEYPQPREMYIVAGDPSDSRQDPSAMIVLKRNTGDIVATWNNPIDENRTGKKRFAKVRIDEFTKKIYHLGRYYNYAILAVESNSLGIGVNNQLLTMGYWNLYRQLRGERYMMNKTEKLGWWTGAQERRDMLVELNKYVSVNPDGSNAEKIDTLVMKWKSEGIPNKEIDLLIKEYKEKAISESGYFWDKRLHREMMHFQEVKKANKHGVLAKKKIEAAPGSTDDMIMAFMIAIMVWREVGRARNVGKVTYTYVPCDPVTGV